MSLRLFRHQGPLQTARQQAARQPSTCRTLCSATDGASYADGSSELLKALHPVLCLHSLAPARLSAPMHHAAAAPASASARMTFGQSDDERFRKVALS